MSMLRILLIIIFLIAALAVTVIVLLQEGKSAGLGSMTGSTGGDSYWEKNKKHSLEGKFEKWTKITAVIFVLSAFLIMLIPNGTTPSGDVTNNTGANSQITAPSETVTDETAAQGETATDETAAQGETATDKTATQDETVTVETAPEGETATDKTATQSETATDTAATQSETVVTNEAAN